MQKDRFIDLWISYKKKNNKNNPNQNPKQMPLNPFVLFYFISGFVPICSGVVFF